MLVLSRKSDESIVFPSLGVTISILRTDRRVARVGIEAPSHIRIVRKELLDGSSEDTFDVESFERASGSTGEQLHELRNQLNTLNLGLQYYRVQMDAGEVDAANLTFLRVINQLEKIEQSVKVQADAASISETNNKPTKTVNVLLVEDDEDQRLLLAGVLKSRGCDVAVAASGDEALKYLESNTWPDYVLLDMRMPNGDGASTVRKLREINASPNLRILATSGTSPKELGINEGPDGVNHWFPKPLNTDGLVQYMHQNETSKLAFA